jgi:hypothetical protein
MSGPGWGRSPARTSPIPPWGRWSWTSSRRAGRDRGPCGRHRGIAHSSTTGSCWSSTGTGGRPSTPGVRFWASGARRGLRTVRRGGTFWPGRAGADGDGRGLHDVTRPSWRAADAGAGGGPAAGGEAGPVHSAGLKVADRLDWPLVDLRIDWADDPIGCCALPGTSMRRRWPPTSSAPKIRRRPRPTECPEMRRFPEMKKRLTSAINQFISLRNQKMSTVDTFSHGGPTA